ncbi:cell division protein FtsQ/DivIB [Anaerobranca gottschalkii]|uniref:Cell division septal protein FtsQ n=1 Tax=Anaerobranca gottschalkii DSM 13577 TaxID=1120990 RepID=A0A1H9YVK9_9FIRM|nr:FtsQ-type POTRA domain-containing protein [Anaerobranca gottschalkii]SES73166.1 Cell division septal protein FtsQ [Anaerobranca gottschalkii DSM 13577]
MKIKVERSNSVYRKNVIDFSKRKRDLSHIQKPKKLPSRKFNFRINKSIYLVLLILLLSSSVYIFLNSQYAILENVFITGNFLLDKQEILLKLPQEGQANFFKTSKKDYIQPLMDNPWIKEVNVVKDYFSRSVHVEITERRPLFRTIENSVISIIDEEGYLLPNLPGLFSVNVPFIIGNHDQKELNYLVSHVKELPDHFLYLLSEINVENLNSIYLYTVDGFIIRVGVISNLTNQRTEEIIKIINLQKDNGKRGIIDIRGQNIIFEEILEG